MGGTDDNSDRVNSVVNSFDTWKHRIIIPTLLAGVAGGGVGLISKHSKVLGFYKTAAAYASNFAIVTGCYCGAREFVRVSRTGKPDDLLNSVVGGFGSGAILGRLQVTYLGHVAIAGRAGAVRYSAIFAAVGTAVDYATIKLRPVISEVRDNSGGWFKLPEWSPIRVLDDEAVAEKRAREQQIYRTVHNLNKEES
ncbi:hypothetical protein F511_09968 [Dorcoceras hygrometricum]|uniref:Mitochondrial import inner membrane translocase subunit Tim17/Tim22/Tim23 family protein n=1 Tax=Dorcoceras hygrometricum TaxID=472368 RepID=A0A2Z7D3K6_9LAMI|nr:hypothetical protein F511_09968 [Dorcoceras hygrometricum]